MNQKTLAAGAVIVLMTAPALAQDRHGTFVKVILDERPALSVIWLNTLHMHSIQPCYPSSGLVQDEFYACVHMDGHRQGNYNRVFRTAERYAPAVRDILSLPNPTWPSAVISGPVTATVGTPVTLTATVTDPDYGDSWTYAWIESSSTMNGGTFGDATAAETTYTPAMVGTVVLWVLVLDDAQQSVSVSHQMVVTE